MGDWDVHLRSLSNSARDSSFSNDPASDPSLLHSVKRLNELCRGEKSEDLVARVYPQINKLFQRAVASLSQSNTSYGLLLLEILKFFLDFGDVVLHDADPSLRTFFRSCLSREFADPVVAEATLDFLGAQKKKFLSQFPMLLPQFFPLMLKLIAWNGEKLEKKFINVFPALISMGSFLPLFPSVVDLPVLVAALEKVEKSSGSLIGSSIATIQKSAAPEMLLALMDEAYTGSTIGDGGVDFESEDSAGIDVADPLFLELLKDENDGLAEHHWTSPGMATLLQNAVNNPKADRLKQSFVIAPCLLGAYFSIALRQVNDSLICALIPLLMSRISLTFPDKGYSYEDIFVDLTKLEILCFLWSTSLRDMHYVIVIGSHGLTLQVQKRLLEFMLSAFQRSPNFIAILKKPIVDRLGEAYDSPAKTELALQLCWAIGEHGGGGNNHKEVARELFESLELLLYENLSFSRLGLRQESDVKSGGETYRRSLQSRLLCFVITAIAKLATRHQDLLPRARVALGKVARSRISDARVRKRACDYLGLMSEPAISMSVLCHPAHPPGDTIQNPGVVKWAEDGNGPIGYIPFYILGEQQGPRFHDCSFSDILPDR